MSTPDDFIQEQVEKGKTVSGLDADAYKIVFNSLKKEPHFKLSADFATRVSALATPEKSFNWERAMLIGGVIGFIIALLYVLVSMKATFSFGAFAFLGNYQGLLFFAITFILILNWIERKLIRLRTEHS